MLTIEQISPEKKNLWRTPAQWAGGRCFSFKNSYRWWNLGSSLRPTDENTINGMVSSSSSRKKIFKVQTSAGKVTASAFWDSQGILLVELLERGVTINSGRYVQTLKKLKQRMRIVRPRRKMDHVLSCRTTPDRTPICAQGSQLYQWGGLFSLILPTVPI